MVCIVIYNIVEWRNIWGVAFYGLVLAGGSLPIATSLCPDELDNHGEEDADEVDDHGEEDENFAEDEEVEDSLSQSSDV